MTKITNILIYVFLFNTLSFISDACIQLNCPICCMISNGSAQCADDPLYCQLDENTDYSSIIIVIVIILLIFIGLPFLIYVAEFILNSQFWVLFAYISEFFKNLLICLRYINCFRRNSQVSDHTSETSEDIEIMTKQ